MKPETQGLGRVNRYWYVKAGKKRFEARWRELDGRIHRKAFSDRKAFDLFCTETAVAVANGRSARFRLSDADAAELERQKEAAASLGKHQSEIFWTNFAALKEKAAPGPGIRVGELVDKFLASLPGEISPEYVRNLAGALKRFAKDFQVPVDRVEPAGVRAWLDGLTHIPGRNKKRREGEPFVAPKEKPIGARTWNNYRGALVALANYGRDHALCDWKLDSIELRKLRETDPAICTPERARLLLEAAPEHLRRSIAIAAFAGVRTEEVQRLRWEDFDWENRVLFLRRKVVKGQAGRRSPRSVPLRANLLEWLKGCEFLAGPVSTYKSSKYLAKAKSGLAGRLGFRWEQNALRHSWISYQIAETGDIFQTATLAGNSPKVIKDHYLKLVTARQAKEWFEIGPKNVSSGLLNLDFTRTLAQK